MEEIICLQQALKRSISGQDMTDRARRKKKRTARALAIAFHGDDREWRGFLSKADAFLAALKQSIG